MFVILTNAAILDCWLSHISHYISCIHIKFPGTSFSFLTEASTALWASMVGWVHVNEVSVTVQTLKRGVPQWGRVQIDNFCAALPLQDCTSRCLQGEGWETVTTSLSGVTVMSVASALTYLQPQAEREVYAFGAFSSLLFLNTASGSSFHWCHQKPTVTDILLLPFCRCTMWCK